MSFVMFATWVLVGVLAGVVAGLVMKRGGHGLKTDIILGLAGSIGGSWIFRGLIYSGSRDVRGGGGRGHRSGHSHHRQRKAWPTEGPGQGKGTMWRVGLGAASSPRCSG